MGYENFLKGKGKFRLLFKENGIIMESNDDGIWHLTDREHKGIFVPKE
jgi:hypothetical protein